MRDFPDMLLEEFLGVPPDRDVEFGIDLLSGTGPLSIAPYHMEPKELAKLKAQLLALLD